ncbi:proline-rich protein 33 [Dendropsophus ebraccatus]|uniref:proline-rich protein 33 n=1 Tax=Dendropsophus ebraccatus TaxID=150705 RepID=UPI00383182EE
MLLTVTPLEDPGPPSPVPPPTPPKPRKDNAKLQRLLRKAAKRSVQASPTLTSKSYRSTLSPVSEGDLENLEPATSQKNKKPPPLNLPPRFQMKGVTHRAPSPYPKQKFTFTVSEQQSLSQYLSPSPVPDAPSPQPFRCSSPNIQFLYPQGGNTPDRLSPRVIANSSPRPCTPQTIETSPKQPPVPQLQVLPSPAIVIHEAHGNDGEPLSSNKNETVNKTQIDGLSTPKCEDTKLPAGSSFHISIPDQQELTFKPSASCSLQNEPTKLVSTLTPSKVTDKEIVHDISKVVEIPNIVSTNSLRTTSVNQALPTGTVKQPEITVTTVSVEVTISPKSTGTTPVTSSTDKLDMVPKTEQTTILKPPEKPKPPRKKPGGGWARLVKHLVVEPEEITFPEPQKTEDKTEKSVGEKKAATEGTPQSKTNRANKMWDALLYHMATANKEQEKPGSTPGSTAPPQLPFFRSRLPLLLHRPRFDARKLKEAASRPLRRVTAFFHRRVAEKETSSSFNRTASGWSIHGEEAKQEDEKKAVDGDMKQ